MRRTIIFVVNMVLALIALVLGVVSLSRGEHQIAAMIGVLYGAAVLGLLGTIAWRLTHPIVPPPLQANHFDPTKRDKSDVS